MKIHVFTVTNESYRYGDLESSPVKFFKTKELRDDYYDHRLKHYRDVLQLVDYGNGEFGDNHAWAYTVSCGEKDLEIIEEKNWL